MVDLGMVYQPIPTIRQGTPLPVGLYSLPFGDRADSSFCRCRIGGFDGIWRGPLRLRRVLYRQMDFFPKELYGLEGLFLALVTSP